MSVGDVHDTDAHENYTINILWTGHRVIMADGHERSYRAKNLTR